MEIEYDGWRLHVISEPHEWCGLWKTIGYRRVDLHEKLGKGWGKKDVKLYHIKKISEKNMGLFTGRLRVSGSNNFRDWYPFDATRPLKKKAIVFETDFKIFKRLWVTPEKHDKVFGILKKLV